MCLPSDYWLFSMHSQSRVDRHYVAGTVFPSHPTHCKLNTNVTHTHTHIQPSHPSIHCVHRSHGFLAASWSTAATQNAWDPTLNSHLGHFYTPCCQYDDDDDDTTLVRPLACRSLASPKIPLPHQPRRRPLLVRPSPKFGPRDPSQGRPCPRSAIAAGSRSRPRPVTRPRRPRVAHAPDLPGRQPSPLDRCPRPSQPSEERIVWEGEARPCVHRNHRNQRDRWCPAAPWVQISVALHPFHSGRSAA